MKFVSNLVNFIKASVLVTFSALDTAELLEYDWDGKFPRAHWHGWCEMWGSPYSVRVNNGEHVAEGGWLEIIHLARLSVTGQVTGANGSAAGRVDFRFQVAKDLFNSATYELPGLAVSVEADGTNTEINTEALDVGSFNFIRVHTIQNYGAQPVDVRCITCDGVRPVKIPDGGML